MNTPDAWITFFIFVFAGVGIGIAFQLTRIANALEKRNKERP